MKTNKFIISAMSALKLCGGLTDVNEFEYLP